MFVAGGAGMAGSAIVEALLNRRPEGRIRATYRSTPPATSDDRVEHLSLDLLDKQTLTDALRGCEAAVLAASESGGIQMLSEEPWRQVRPNLVLAATWLEALHDAGVGRAVFIGSAVVYQPFDGAIREDALDLNHDPAPEAFGVGWVMRATEKLCEFWERAAGLEIVRVRAANIYGPRARFDPARSNFIPALIRKVVDRQDPLDVWGSPEVTRDVIYSADFGEAIARLLDAPGAGGKVFNVGSGRAVSVGEVVKTLLQIADYEGRAWCTRRPLRRRRATGRSIATACVAELQWMPATSLEDGLRETLRWWRANRTTWQR